MWLDPMRTPDLIRFARGAATGNPLRSTLLVVAMAASGRGHRG